MITKQITIFITTFILIFNIIPQVYAYDYPPSFWSANNNYEAALNSNNYSDIIKYGEQL